MGLWHSAGKDIRPEPETPYIPFCAYGTVAPHGFIIPQYQVLYGLAVDTMIGNCSIYNGFYEIDLQEDSIVPNNVREGGCPGDICYYIIHIVSSIRSGTWISRSYVADKISVYYIGDSDYMTLHFYSNRSVPSLKISALNPNPTLGNDNIQIYNPNDAPVNLDDWKLRDRDGWEMSLQGLAIPPFSEITVDLGGDILSNAADGGPNAGDEISLCWHDTTGISAGGMWVSLDLVEYGNQQNPYDNSVIPDYPCAPIQGYRLVRYPDPYTDTENCANDFVCEEIPYPVHNINTDEYFSEIQAAIEDPDTLDAHTIEVAAGTYYENIFLNKSINLKGKDKNTTIIDGSGTGFAVNLNADFTNITGFSIINCFGAIRAYNVKHGFISNNHIENTTQGISMDRSESVSIAGNEFCDIRGMGIYSYQCNNNLIAGNTISSTGSGIQFAHCQGFTLTGNVMAGTGIYLVGIGSIDYWNTHSIDDSNTINGKPVYYWKDRTGGTVPSGAGQVILANCNNVIVENQNVSGGSNGIQLGYSDSCIIRKNTAHDNYISGLYLWNCNDNGIERNSVANSPNYAIYFGTSSSTSYNFNTIKENNLVNCGYGIYLFYSQSNLIYHNNFLNNKIAQAYEYRPNFWDNGYPAGGNYWSRYSGTDDYSGPGQNEPGSDGIGDIPYTGIPMIQGGSDIDNYPLMNPWSLTMPTATATGPQGAGHGPNITITYTWTETPSKVDLFYSTNQGGGWNYLGTDDTVDGSYDWTPDANPGPKPSKFYWIANAKDGADDVGIPANGTAPEAGPFNWKTFDVNIGDNQINGGSGYWAFVSVPLNVDTDITAVFNDALYGDGGTAWDCIKWYNPKDKMDPWKTYRVGGSANDLFTYHSGIGVWIHIITNDGDGLLTAGEGIETTGIAVSLSAGWNMVGYPTYCATKTVGDAFWGTGADRVEVFDPASPYMISEVGPTYVMKPGQGYWVHVPADTVWTVDW